MPDLKAIKAELQMLMIDDMGDALKKLNAYLHPDARMKNDLIMLEARYNSALKKQRNGLISESQANLSFNRLNHSLLQLIDDLKADDLNEIGMDIPGDAPMSASSSFPTLNPDAGQGHSGGETPQPDLDKMEKQALYNYAMKLMDKLNYLQEQLVTTSNASARYELETQVKNLREEYDRVKEKLSA